MALSDSEPPTEPQFDSIPPLRRQAEDTLGLAANEYLEARSPEEVRSLVYELRVHQIELELQNDELRRTQYELELARARYFDLYDLAPVGYFTLSAQGLIQEANLTAATFLQVPRDNLLRRLLSHFIVPEDQDIYYLHRRQLSKTGESQVCELRVLRLDQSLCWVRLETAAVIEASGEVVGYRTVMSDITARAQAEAALRDLNATLERRVDERTAALVESENLLRRLNVDLAQALRLKDEFLALITHELRTPLSTILFLIDSLLEGVYGPPTEHQRHAVLRAQQSGQHLLRLISDIIDLTYIAAGHDILDLQPINVESLCAMALLLIKPAAEAKGIEVQQMIAPGITQLCADERRITQILVHLLNNALKFTPAGGSIGLDLAIDASRDHILLSVWDTGIGIAPADQHRAFEPFIQLDGRLSREYDGAGLGLTLVQRLTELHGGSVDLVSAPNQGSRFTVSLPWFG